MCDICYRNNEFWYYLIELNRLDDYYFDINFLQDLINNRKNYEIPSNHNFVRFCEKCFKNWNYYFIPLISLEYCIV